MHAPPPWSLETLVRVLARLDWSGMAPHHRTLAAEMLGLAHVNPGHRETGRDPADARLETAAPRPRRGPRERRRDRVPSAMPPPAAATEAAPRRTRLYRLPARSAPAPEWMTSASPLDLTTPAGAALVPDPLFAPARVRGILSAALKASPVAGAVDIAALIERIARAAPLVQVPRQRSWAFADHLLVVNDRSSAMTAYRTDVAQLLRTLRHLAGRDRVRLATVEGWPPASIPPGATGAVALIVSDFALLPAPDGGVRALTRDWEDFAARLAAAGWTPIGLTPADPLDWPDKLVAALPLIHWAETTNARTARAATHRRKPNFLARTPADRADDLAAMADIAALAARLDARTMRAVRRLVTGGRSPALEAVFRASGHVDSRGETAVTMAPADVKTKRAAFCERPIEQRRAAIAAIRKAHAGGPAHYRFEERLVALLVEQPDGWEDRLADELRAATRTLLDDRSPASRDLAVWMLRALPRLEFPPRLHEDAAALFYAAAATAGAVPQRRAAPGALPAPNWLTPEGEEKRPKRTIGATWGASGLALRTVRQSRIEPNAIAHLDHDNEKVTSIAFSPDGNRLATGSWNRIARLWDATTWTEIARIQGHGDVVTTVAFSPDGVCLITGCGDGKARLWWHANGGTQTVPFEGHGASIQSVAASSNGDRLTTGSDDHTARLWLADSGAQIAVLSGHGGPVYSVAFSPNGSLVATGSADRTARLWNTAEGVEIARFDEHGGPVFTVAFSPDGALLATGSADRAARLWDVVSGRAIIRLEGHGAFVNSVAFSPDGKSLATGSHDGTVRLWNVVSGAETARLESRGTQVASVGFSPDGDRIAVAAGDAVSIHHVSEGPVLSDAGIDPYQDDADPGLLWSNGRHFAAIANREAGWSAEPEGDGAGAVALVPDALRPAAVPPARWIDLQAPGGERFRIEDAEDADRREPLRVFALVHPDDREAAAPLLDELETLIRGHAGLPPHAAVLQRRLVAQTWREPVATKGSPEAAIPQTGDRWVWSEAVRAEFLQATATVIVGSPSLFGEDQHLDAIRLIMAAHPAPQARRRKVFIRTQSSRTGLVRAITEAVVADLRDRGYAPWFDQQDIPPGADWREAEDDAIRTSDGVLALLDRQAHIEWPGWESDLLSARGRKRDLDVPIFVANLAREPIAPETFETSLITASQVWERPDGVPPTDVDRVARHLVEAAVAALGPPTMAPSSNLHAVLLPQSRPPESAAQPEELDWLARLVWEEPDELHAIAEETAGAWRRQRISFGTALGDDRTATRISPEAPYNGVRYARALQALAMVFHEQRFHPETGAGVDPRPDLWGLPMLTDGAPDTQSREWRDFEAVRYNTEYLYAEEVVRSIESGEDLGELRSPEEVKDAITVAITALAEGTRLTPHPHSLGQYLDSFALFATARERRLFGAQYGDLDAIRSALRSGSDEAPAPEWLERLQERSEVLGNLLRPYSSRLMTLAARREYRGAPPVTFVEFLEELNGLLCGYLATLAARAPQTVALVSQDGWYKEIEPVLQDMLPHALGFQAHTEALLSRLPAEELLRRGLDLSAHVVIPIQYYHDMVAALCDLVLWALRRRGAGVPRDGAAVAAA